MKNTIIFLMMLSVMIGTGCEKRLEIVPQFTTVDEAALSTVDGLDAALSNAYAATLQHIGRNSTFWSEAMADHFFYKGTVTNWLNYYRRDLKAIVEETSSATDARKVSAIALGNLYRPINVAALVIRGIERGYPNSDLAFPTNKDRLLGEAYFLRAALHFEIVRTYARAWDATPDNSHPGIVINKEAVEDRESQVKARSSVKEVYDFIIEDLKKAEELLPVTYDATKHTPVYNGRTYKDAARALLARVYFQKLDYVNAKAVIDKILGPTAGNVINHPLETGDITLLFKTRGPDDTNPENIWQTTASVVINSYTTYWNNSPNVYGLAPSTASNARVTSSFLQDAKFYPNDNRLTVFLRPGVDGMIPNKYSLRDHFNQPQIRSAEMILDRAEINAMAGNLPDAIADCNLIRGRATIPLLPNTILQGPLIDTIRTERIRELSFEGDRLWNLKRLKLPIPPGERGGATLPWDGVELVFKFTPEEMSRNLLLVNNY